jgi:hypothetical protein
MDGPCPLVKTAAFRQRPLWVLVLLALVAVQGWLTLRLFGGEHAWQQVLNDQPILSGRHPLHLYHGLLGSYSLCRWGRLSCYDPAFQAGYPKTPVFDSGSRPAELFLSLGGGSSAAYKVGLLACCCAVPLLLAGAARGVGLGPPAACVAAAAGMLVCWGKPCRAFLEAGDLDLLLAGLATVVLVALLLWFHRAPGVLTWLGMASAGTLAWFAQPLFVLLMIPLLLVFYHSVGVRHGWAWHLALAAGLAAGVALNSFWLFDWVQYWWLRLPAPGGPRLLTHRTFQTFWDCPVWGNPADRAVAMVLLASGIVGVTLYALGKARPTARLLGFGLAGLLVPTLVGLGWEPLGRHGTTRLLVPALWLAVLPAVYSWQRAWDRLGDSTGPGWRTAALAGVLLAGGWAAAPQLSTLAESASGPPLTIGLSTEQQALVEVLKGQTSAEARILWEECRSSARGAWAALLPLWTGRLFVGGLDPDGRLEHSQVSLVDGKLAGRPLADWSDAELETLGRRYNLGWVVCRSPAAVARFEAWCGQGAAQRSAILTIDGEPAHLYTLGRPRSFVLQGQARWLHADSRHIILGDVMPEGSTVVLSLHFDAGLEASPRQVQIERDPDPLALDPIPMVRLRVNGPVTRIILTWPGS